MHYICMTTCNFQCTSLFLYKVIRVQSKEDNQGYKEMKGDMLIAMIAISISRKTLV